MPFDPSINFLVDKDHQAEGDVAEARTLNIGIIDGRQVLPVLPIDGEVGANRLGIFTGTVVLQRGGDHERQRGFVRIRLRFPLTKSVTFVGSACVAALATISGKDADTFTGADAAEIALEHVPIRSNHFPSSCPRLSRASTSFLPSFSRCGVDGRDKPGHDSEKVVQHERNPL
jgi:hypothetical protein